MSDLKVEVCLIEEVAPHDNADRLEMVRVKGWWVVTSKATFEIGDKCVYIPIDSILPANIENKLFPEGSKIKLHGSRIRTIKIRGNISQGMVCPPETLDVFTGLNVGADITKYLGITKYEPPEPSQNSIRGGRQVSLKVRNTNFSKYTNIQNIKNHPNVFKEDNFVWVSEKLHGTSFRAGWLPTEANTWWKKVLKFCHLLSKFEFCFGSRNVQLQEMTSNPNVYAKMVKQYDLMEKLGYGEVLYGEIVGAGIQHGYTYGHKEGEHSLYVYDIMQNGNYVDYDNLIQICEEEKLNVVPTLYLGSYDYELFKQLTEGCSTICQDQKVREGVVIKSFHEQNHSSIGRKVLKFLSDKYLLNKNNSDNH